MSNTTPVLQYGLGPIGCAIARHVVASKGIELVGAVDIDPAKAGKDAGEVIGLDHPLGVTVVESLARAPAADIALHTTSSYLNHITAQITELLAAGLDVVSTAEELSFPWLAHPNAASSLDVASKQAGKTVLGTGVNPGFLMDSLPLALTAICQRVDRIEVTRVINASTRRGPFQAKIGSGLTVSEFRTRLTAGRLGHVGLRESLGMVFDTLGKQLVRYESYVEPVIAEQPIKTAYCAVPSGRVRGLKQVARGHTGVGEFMALTFIAALDADNEGDTVKISGQPDLNVTLTGTNGDIATAAIVVNAIRQVRAAAPGLVTMRDLPLVTTWEATEAA